MEFTRVREVAISVSRKLQQKTLEQFQKYCRPFYEVELYQGQLNLSVHVEWCYKKTRYANHKTINPHYFNLELHNYNTFNTINIIQFHDNTILIMLLSARAYFFDKHIQVNCKNGHRLTWAFDSRLSCPLGFEPKS